MRHIYKANQCTDEIDFDIAIREIKHYIKHLEFCEISTKGAYRRLNSLIKGKEKLNEKV